MKISSTIGAVMLGAGVVLIGMSVSNNWPPPLIVPGAWLSIIGGILLIGSLFERHSYKTLLNVPPAGYEPMQERFVDTRTNKPVRVYHDPATGERAYVLESSPH